MAYTTIDKSDDYFNILLWTGNGASPRALSGLGFNPDWIWTKARNSGSVNHAVWDIVRGGNIVLNPDENYPDNNGAAIADHGVISSFTSPTNDGFTVADGSSAPYPRLTVNDASIFGGAAGNYVGWCWKAGGTASSNTNGTITSNVSANTTSGFSIVSYTGTGSNATVGHGLGVAPKMVIVKNRDTTNGWEVFHASMGATKVILLDRNEAEQTVSGSWNDTAPTSSVFSIGTSAGTNGSSNDLIAYCFAEKKGFSKFGSYTGNGNADGTFVYTGFKPAFFMIKRTTSNGYDWLLYDNKRQVSFNVIDDFLNPNSPSAETTGNANQSLDFLSNGVKHRGNGASSNASGVTFIYMAFAENPFVTSTRIPACAR